MVEPTLATQLERLDSVRHPALQRLTVAAIFQQLAKPTAARSKASDAALQACTGHQDQVRPQLARMAASAWASHAALICTRTMTVASIVRSLFIRGSFLQVVVEESAQQLLRLVVDGSWDPAAALDTLLAALSASGEGTRP